MSKNANARDNAKGHGKEIKIGLGVLALLLISLCAVGVMRFMGDSDAPTAAIAGSETAEDAFANVDQSSQATLLKSEPYSASTSYSGSSQSGVDWTKSADQSSVADEIPSRPLSAKASDPLGASNTDSYDAASSGSNIPPAAKTEQAHSARGQNADLVEANASQTIPAAPANATELNANRLAMRPASASQIAQQEYQPQVQQNAQAYDATAGYANAAAQNPAAQHLAASQGSIPSQSSVLPAAQTIAASQYANSDQYAPAQNMPAQNVPGQYAQENQPAEVPNYDASTQYSAPTQYSVPQTNANYSRQQQQQYAPQPLTPQPLGNVEIDQQAVRKGRAYIQPGETMWTLSRRVYGSSAFFKALSEHNRQRLPNSHDLKIGDEVLTPKVTVLRQRYPGLCPRERKRKPGMSMTTQVSATMIRAGRTYVVEKGDTLYDIARYELGSGAQWPLIYQLNQRTLGDDFDYLKPGTKLTLPARAARPASQSGDALAERPGHTIRQ